MNQYKYLNHWKEESWNKITVNVEKIKGPTTREELTLLGFVIRSLP